MQYIGCHLTISKGFSAMGRQAVELGANTAQFFTRNPRGGKAKDIDPADIQGLRDIMAQHGFGPLIAHAPYTINPCAQSRRRWNLPGSPWPMTFAVWSISRAP